MLASVGLLELAFADAPVSGGRGGALAGKLALMAACPDAIWAEIEPLLAVFAIYPSRARYVILDSGVRHFGAVFGDFAQ